MRIVKEERARMGGRERLDLTMVLVSSPPTFDVLG